MRKLTTRKAIALSVCWSLFVSGQAAADDVVNDDQIVIGNECVGPFGCADGEVFNFDTLRLKTTNARLSFIDTSSAPFATRDWRIEANSSASGGASYLALKDMGNTSTGAEDGTPLLYLSAGAPARAIGIYSLFAKFSAPTSFRFATSPCRS